MKFEDLCNGEFSEEIKSNCTVFYNTVLAPLSEKFNIDLVKGIIRPNQIFHIDSVIMNNEHIFGYGADITAGEDNDAMYDYIAAGNVPVTSLARFDDYIHVAYNEYDYIRNSEKQEI